MSTITQFPSGNTQYRIEFDYLARTFVVVTLVNSSNPTLNRVLEVGRDYRFLNPTMIEMLVDQSGFDIVRIHRQTGTDLVVDFRNGSVLTASDLTNAELQAIHIAEEGRDQTVDLAKEYADAAGSSAGSAKDSEDEARRIAESIKASGKIGYITRRSFEKGFNVTTWNEVLLWEGDGDYYRWDGTLPKNVPAGSTPETSGGIGSGAWVSVGDASLRQHLSSSEDSLGGSLVMLPQEISVSDALKGVVVVSGADSTGVVDATAIIQKYIDYAHAHGFGTVRVPAGTYKVQEYTHQIELPHDDGTVYPAWVTAGTDVNIGAEPTNYMYAALKLYPGIKLVGDGMSSTILDGGWDIASGPIGIASGIGVWYHTPNMQSDHDGGGLFNITLQRFFVPRYGTGCTVDTEEDRIKLKRVGISGIFQAKERCKIGFIYIDQAYSGDVVGGQWWYRSDSTSARYMPSYPAPQIYLTGWMDACITEQYWYIQYLTNWGARHEAIDAFFDTYFFKNANNDRYNSGGRLSNNAAGGAVNTFRGISGRAFSMLARYGQQPNANTFINLKTYGTHRTAIYTGDNAVSSGSMNSIQTAYIERSGLVNALGSIGYGNYFGIDYVDPMNSSRSGIGYSVVEGFFGMGSILRSTGQPAAYGSFRSYHQESAASRKTLFVDSVSDSNLLHYEEVYDKSGASVVPIRWYSDKGYIPPVLFNNGSRQFSFVHGTFTATLLSTSASILTGTGYYCRKGNEISLRVAFTVPAGTLASITGFIRVSGLPYTMSSIGYAHGAVRWPALSSGISLNPQIDAAATTIKLFTDSAENEAVGASVINSSYGSSSLLVVSLTYRTDDV